jgi:hypothetical protein
MSGEGMNVNILIGRALRQRWLDETPLSATGKRLYGVNARRRRQAKTRAISVCSAELINKYSLQATPAASASAEMLANHSPI